MESLFCQIITPCTIFYRNGGHLEFYRSEKKTKNKERKKEKKQQQKTETNKQTNKQNRKDSTYGMLTTQMHTCCGSKISNQIIISGYN